VHARQQQRHAANVANDLWDFDAGAAFLRGEYMQPPCSSRLAFAPGERGVKRRKGESVSRFAKNTALYNCGEKMLISPRKIRLFMGVGQRSL
jgi:hypothetical protein